MKNVISADRLWRDREGATFLEFTFVFPLLVLLAFCTVDFALVMFDWAQANKAAQRGARLAVISAPVAAGINDPEWGEDLGAWCVDPATGASTGLCPTVETVCTAGADPADDECTNGYDFAPAAFESILEAMQAVSPYLNIQRENVQVSYRTAGMGFVGRPGGLPMEVTVELRCKTHQLFFLGAFAGWAFEYENCPDGTSGAPIPGFATTLTTEALGS